MSLTRLFPSSIVALCVPVALLTAALLTIAIVTVAHAATPAREVTLPATVGQLDQLVPVIAPGAKSATVNDVAGVLVIGHKPGVAPQVSLFALDDQGQPSTNAIKTITLPKPEALGSRTNYPLALAVHPTLPLLYVWQDIATAEKDPPADNLESDGFCHLLIYDLATAEPKLVQSGGRGEDYARSNVAGGIAVDVVAQRLFVPNLRRPATGGTFAPAIGYLRLDARGLAEMDGDDVALEISTGGRKKPTQEQPKGLVLAARRAELAAAKTGLNPVMPGRATRAAVAASATFGAYPCGLSFWPVSDTVTLVCGALGPVTWDEANRRAQFTNFTFYPLIGVGYQLRMAGHPTLPVLFFSGLTSGWVYRMEHVDGFPTMLPQRGILAGAALASAPIVMPRRNQLACGGANAVHLIRFDTAGCFTGERCDVKVPCPTVQALAYSPRFDRLYVAVEKAP